MECRFANSSTMSTVQAKASRMSRSVRASSAFGWLMAAWLSFSASGCVAEPIGSTLSRACQEVLWERGAGPQLALCILREGLSNSTVTAMRALAGTAKYTASEMDSRFVKPLTSLYNSSELSQSWGVVSGWLSAEGLIKFAISAYALLVTAALVVAGVGHLVLYAQRACSAAATTAATSANKFSRLLAGIVTLPFELARRPFILMTMQNRVKDVVVKYCPNPQTGGQEMPTKWASFIPAELPSSTVCLVDYAGMHVGFATLAPTMPGVKGAKVCFHTAWHVLKHAVMGDGKVRLASRTNAGKAVVGTPVEIYSIAGRDACGFVLDMPMDRIQSFLGVRAAKTALYSPRHPVQVFSPPESAGSTYESSSSASKLEVAGKVSYWASTRPGASGSPIMQNGCFVGVHTEANETTGRNEGTVSPALLYFVHQRAQAVTKESAERYEEHVLRYRDEWDRSYDDGFHESSEDWQSEDEYEVIRFRMEEQLEASIEASRRDSSARELRVSVANYKPKSGFSWADDEADVDFDRFKEMARPKSSVNSQPPQKTCAAAPDQAAEREKPAQPNSSTSEEDSCGMATEKATAIAALLEKAGEVTTACAALAKSPDLDLSSVAQSLASLTTTLASLMQQLPSTGTQSAEDRQSGTPSTSKPDGSSPGPSRVKRKKKKPSGALNAPTPISEQAGSSGSASPTTTTSASK